MVGSACKERTSCLESTVRESEFSDDVLSKEDEMETRIHESLALRQQLEAMEKRSSVLGKED